MGSKTSMIGSEDIGIFQPVLQSPRLRAMSGEPTIFDKILDGSIPATFIHQDEQCVAFNDVAPQVT